MRLTNEQKDKLIEAVKLYGTYGRACKVLKINLDDLRSEMKKSAIFRKRMQESRKEGKENLAERAIDKITEYMDNPPSKTDRNVLTAAIALANAYEPGFKGTSKVDGKIEHDIRVISAVPRPDYTKIEVSKEDKEKLKQLNTGKPIKSIDKPKSVEEAIEGEIIDEEGQETQS